MRCFVTGGAGFIGSHLVDRLLKVETNSVTVYDNLSSGRRELLAEHDGNRHLEIIEGDLLDKRRLSRVIEGHEFVFHLAANSDIRKGAEQTDLDLKQNLITTYNILESMCEKKIKKIAFTSTSAVFGESIIFPTPEYYGPSLPISLYGASKLACEGLISAYCHIFGIRSWIFRFANIVGSRATHGVLFDFIEKLKQNPIELEILGDGEQCKSYLDVESCVDAMLFIIDKTKENVNLYNIGNEDQINVTKIAEIVIEEMGLPKVDLKYSGDKRGWKGDVPKMILSIDKIKNLGWSPKYNSQQTIRRSIKGILQA
jgi:UDP-glucose 4-epimerase